MSSSRERAKTANVLANVLTSSPSSPSAKSIKKAHTPSPPTNRKSQKLDVPKSFTIDVGQITAARKQLKTIDKGESTNGELASITLSSPEKQGTLKMMCANGWAPHWCVLKEGRLYVFLNAKAATPEKVISLHGSKVGERKQSGVENCFQINTMGGDAHIFCAEADEDYDYITWIVALRGATFYLKISSFAPPLKSLDPSSPTVLSPATSPPTSPKATSPVIPRIETTSASPAPVKRTNPARSSTNAVPPDVKAIYRNSADISKLPSRATEVFTSSDSLKPSRKSADVSKLSKSMDLTPLSEAISAAYRKSSEMSKSATSIHSPTSPLSSSGPANLFASAEIISSDSHDSAKGRRGFLGVPTGGLFNKSKQRWVVLDNDTMCVYKHEEDEGKVEPLQSFELVFCQPKVVQSEKGKYLFEVHAPGRTAQFSAPSSVELLEWINAIQETQTTLMQSYLQYNMNGKEEDADDEKKEELEMELEKSKKRLANIMKLDGNNHCADCGAPDPLWATINFGVFICIECSGVHRQMGTHISKVRSITMDKWDSEVLEFMESTGNTKVNSELEADIPPQYTKLTPSSSRQERDAFIRAKYETKQFTRKP